MASCMKYFKKVDFKLLYKFPVCYTVVFVSQQWQIDDYVALRYYVWQM
jgi:hypothetical protein